jgi:hypothetical protein
MAGPGVRDIGSGASISSTVSAAKAAMAVAKRIALRRFAGQFSLGIQIA